MKPYKVFFENGVMKVYEMPEEPTVSRIDKFGNITREWFIYREAIQAARAAALPVATESIPGFYHLIKWQMSLSDYKEGKHDDQPFFNPDFTKEYQIECDFQEKVIQEHEIIHGTLGRETIWNDVKVLVLVEQGSISKYSGESLSVINQQESKPKDENTLWRTDILLPCPFCGSKPEWINKILGDGHYYIQCSEGSCRVCVKADRHDKAIGFWNRRKSIPAKEESQEELINALQRECNCYFSNSMALEIQKRFTIHRKPQQPKI